MCAITHTARTSGGLCDEENDEEQELRPKVDEGRLGDLDFADDIALLEDTQEVMREFTYKTQEVAAKV